MHLQACSGQRAQPAQAGGYPYIFFANRKNRKHQLEKINFFDFSENRFNQFFRFDCQP